MKILNWNVRGAGRKGFKHHFKSLIHSYNPDIITLMETRVHFNRTKYILTSLNFSHFSIILAEEFSAGVWLLWKASHLFSLQIPNIDRCFFH